MIDRSRSDGRSRLIRILAERIVAEWLAETATLEPAPDRPHNVTHDDITHSPAPRRVIQPLQF
jgi:hypothetical protein